jgi:DNA mismatch repair protein MutS
MANDLEEKPAEKSGEKPAERKITPLMAQYWDIKQAHDDKVVLFRMGDFYEMFHRDAEIAAPVLGIALTARNKKSADETPMCGVPYHSVANSINKLLANGFKVAICDQVEDPKLAKGLVKRAITRILSPGIVYDPDTLDGVRANYLASFDERSVSFLDVTTGEAFFFLVKDRTRRERLLANLQPVEIIIEARLKSQTEFVLASSEGQPLVTVHEGYGPEEFSKGWPKQWPDSAHRLLAYAFYMQGAQALETIAPFERRELLDRMELSATTVRHLEIFETYNGEARGALFHAINRTKTSSGARLLRSWLKFPLVNQAAIEHRLDLVEKWHLASEKLKAVRMALQGLGDVQRRLAKIASQNVNPRDLQSLAESLKAGLEVCEICGEESWERDLIDASENLVSEIERTISDEPPVQIKNGGVIRQGYSKALDELIELATNSNELILKLEAEERDLTGISSLKIRFNNVFGYYIEITNTHRDKVPKDRFERKQTLANAERYITPELAALESKVLSAQAKRNELESRVFLDLIARILKEAQKVLKLSMRWAEIDVVSSLALLASEQDYCRPRFVVEGGLNLRRSRHPVIEQTLAMPFIANDIEIGKGGCLLLTGPNMAGKSTLMRQVAVSALLAQAGSFVPAKEAELPIFDRLFTRIGATDFLSEGLSTFMVEMKETAEVLSSSTENSLVILDEIGRGTSTFDGMSLAQAILEYLLESRQAMTMFATHYHELTQLAQSFPRLSNAHMKIHESQGVITFLHQLAAGPANKSYGIHVARLAGIPNSVTRRASAILKKLEGDTKVETQQMTLLSLIDRHASDEEPEKITAEFTTELAAIDLSAITPLEALNQIARWQQSLS